MNQPRRDRYRPPHHGSGRPVPAPRGPQPARGLFQVSPASSPEPEYPSPDMAMGAIIEAAQAANEEIQATLDSMEHAIRRINETTTLRKMPEWTWDNLEWADADVVGLGSFWGPRHREFWDPGVWEVEK